MAGTASGACGSWPPDENANRGNFEVLVVNNSEEHIYRVFGPPEATEPSGRFSVALPGQERRIRIGLSSDDGGETGGCFEEHLWLLVSRSGETYQQGDISEYVDDYEIIEHFSPGVCTDRTKIRVEYDG